MKKRKKNRPKGPFLSHIIESAPKTEPRHGRTKNSRQKLPYKITGHPPNPS